MGTDAGNITVDVQNGGVFVPPVVDIDALAQNSLGDAVVKLLDYSIQNRSFDADTAVDSYYEYIAAGEEAKPEAYRKAVDAISTSLNSAIAEQQVKGADISSLAALKAQVEAGGEGYVRYARFNHNAQQTRMADEQQAELVANAEAMLIRVSRQSGDFGLDALHDTYYHGYLTGDGDIQPAVGMALRSIDMALTSSEVATGDKATLRGMKGRLENIDSKRSVGDNSNGFGTNGGYKKTGGYTKIDTSKFTIEEYIKYEEMGENMYAAIRQNKDDVEKIAKNTGWDKVKIEAIKNHIFYDTHLFADGSERIFDSDYWQAEAWKRMEDDDMVELDELLLKHEFYELGYIREHHCTYEEAHREATKLFDWYGEMFIR